MDVEIDMAEGQTKRKVGRPKKTDAVSSEFNSYSYRVANSNFWFGFNIFDYYNENELIELVRDPMGHNDMLREISLILYSTNGVYTNTVDYMTAMPTLERVIVSHGKNSEKKRKNKELMSSTLRTIKDKEIVRDALWRGMVEGIAFYYFEVAGTTNGLKKYMSDFDVENIAEINELGVNVSIVSLPANYTKIVSIKNNSYVIAFDLAYFNDAVGESLELKLRKYPAEIREAYKAWVKSPQIGNWKVLDNTKTIVHKIRSKRDEKYGRPLVLAAIADILYNDYFTNTKRNILDEINNKIIYQTLPEGKDKGTCALTKTQQENQHNIVKNAVMSKNNRGGISFFTVAAGTKLDSIDTHNTELFDDKNESGLTEKIATDLGIAASLLSGVGSGSYSAQVNNLELLSAQIFQWTAQIEAELNKCISYNIVQDTKNRVECHYLEITYANKEETISNAKDLFLQGRGSLQYWVAACGISPEAYFALLDEEVEEDFEHKYPVHATSYNTSGDQSPGRPPDNTSNNENTLQSKSNNSNAMPKPSTR